MVQSLPQSDGFRILFNSPELSEVQRLGFHLFLKKGIAEELSKISCIQIRTVHFSVEIHIDAQNFRLVAPENNYRDCILKMKSYTCKLYVQAKILFKDKVSGELLYQTQPEWVLLADLPMMTKRGHFVINGSPRIVVHQVGRAPGIYFKKILKVKKDITNQARFYGDIIPRKGVWVRLQISKKGEIDLKLKKSKKVRAEMVQKCLELLEKEESLWFSLTKQSFVKSGFAKNCTNFYDKNFVLLKAKQKNKVSFTEPFAMNRVPIRSFLPTRNGKQSYNKTLLNHSYSRSSAITELDKNEVFVNSFVNVIQNKVFFREANQNHRQLPVFKQKQLFFNPQTLLLIGVSLNNCFYSKTRQTQAFVIRFSTNHCQSEVPYQSKALRKAKQSDNKQKHSFCEVAESLIVPSLKLNKLLSENDSGKLSYAFTKAEKEAFVNVYTSFYKNEIQDLEERVSMPLSMKLEQKEKIEARGFVEDKAKQNKNEVLQTPTNLFSVTELPIELKDKFSEKNKSSKKKRSAKKQNIINNLEKVREYLYQLFKRSDLYDLGPVGREKINTKFGISVMETQLTALDIKEAINWLSKLRAGREETDDIDHSQNRRVRTSSELIQTQFSIGITRLKNLVTKKVRNGKDEQIKASIYKQASAKQSFGGGELLNKALPFSPYKWDNKVEPHLCKQSEVDRNSVSIKQDFEYNPVFKYKALFGVSHLHLYLAIIFVKSNFGLQIVKKLPQVRTLFDLLPKTKFVTSRDHLSRLQVKTKQKLCSTLLTRFRGDEGTKKVKRRSTSKNKEENYVFPDLNQEVRFGQMHVLRFKMASNCFVKNQKLIDNLELHFEKKITFTSINPYFVTSKQKKIYYSNWSKLKYTRSRLQRQRNHLIKENLQSYKAYSYPNVKQRANKNPIKRGFVVPVQASLYQSFTEKNSLQLLRKKQSFFHVPICTGNENNLLSNLSISEWFSTKPINGALREFFSSSPLSQYMDQTNPLAEVTHKRRLSSLGIGGVSRESAGMTIRGIHPTHYGRICPIETPEGKNAGLVNSLAFYAKINDQGFIETPYYRVMKGQIQHELGFSFYSAGQESRNGLYIAPNDIKQSEKSKLLATTISTVDSIPVRVADNLLDLFKKVSPYQVNCIGISPVQILSVATSLIPFLEHNDANRALMGSNMQRQAVSLMSSERPLVGTGLEARVLAESGHLVQSKVSGFVSNISAHQVVVQRLLNINVTKLKEKLFSSQIQKPLQSCFIKGEQSLNTCGLFAPNKNKVFVKTKAEQKTKFFCYKLLFAKQTIKNEVFVQNSDVYKGNDQSFASRNQTKFSYNFAVPSTTKFWPDKTKVFVRSKQLTNQSFVKRRTKTLVLSGQEFLLKRDFSLIMSCNKGIVSGNVPFVKKKVTLFPVTHSINTFSRSNQETCFTQKPLVEEGDWVQRGDMLSDCSAGQKGELSVGKNMLIAYIPWQGYNFEDAIVISDRLVKEQLYTSLHIERYTVIVNDFKDKVVDTNEWFTGNLPGVDTRKRSHLQKSGLPRIGTILKEGDILVGKIKYSKKKPATPHEKLVCDILGEHNFSVQNTSLYVPKGVHEARVLAYKIKTRFGGAEALKNNLRPAGAPKVVHLFLGEKRNIQVGDKMSGRHGNKGIVSTILPKQDMPYLADGSPIDILLNPLGVPSRMNVGQVFECLLGLASTYLHQNFKVTAFDELYGVEASQSLVFLKLYQARLQSGQNWLFQVNFPGKTRLTDGRSGECLDQWITVGRAYMLKLIHMVNEKIHARAIGPYALVTQQPLKGRAHKGGQRLGEMEVWAVEGFGAAYILQELLTKKSDDSIGRKEVLKAMLPKSTSDFLDPFNQTLDFNKTTFSYNSASVITNSLDNVSATHSNQENRVHTEDETFAVLGQPDIFKVLICELQALCLDVGVYSIKTESFQRQFVGVFE